jgi:hypothetical protein
MTRFLFCLLAVTTLAAPLVACETIPAEPKSIEVDTSQTSEATMPMMTPQPVKRCEKFMSSIDMAEKKIAEQPMPSMTMADAL